MSCGVGHRPGLDPELLWLWLWRRLVATAPIQPLAWEPPRAAGALSPDRLLPLAPLWLVSFHASEGVPQMNVKESTIKAERN